MKAEIEWVKRDGGSWSDTNARLNKHVLDIQPIEPKDIGVYTCVARLAGSSHIQRNTSVALDNDLKLRRLYDSSTHKKRPQIIEIYKFGEQKFNHEYSLQCIAGKKTRNLYLL